jgi:hypothetical protein
MAKNNARDDSDFKTLIGVVYDEMHQICVEVGLRLSQSSSTVTATGAASYALSSFSPTAAGHMHTLRMTRVLDDGREVELSPLQPHEEAAFQGRTGPAVKYAIVDSTAYLYPKPSDGTYKLYWVPQPTDYSTAIDATTIDVMCSAGERFVIYGVAVLVQGELEGNASFAYQERERAREDLQVWAANRSLLEVGQRGPIVADDDDIVARRGDGDWDGWWP